MNRYRVMYRWQDREYITTMPARNAASAITAASFQIMAGAQVFAVERAA